MGGQHYRNSRGITLPSFMLTGDKIFPWTDTYEPSIDTMISRSALSTGTSPLEMCYDMLLDVDGPHRGVLWHPLFDYTGNNDNIAKGLELPNIIPGFDDAG